MNINPLNRRQLVKLAVGAGAVTAAFGSTGQPATAMTKVATPTKGLISIHPLGPVTLHTYVSPAVSAVVTSHIIETANELHIIDAQFMQEFAMEVRAYADSLGKPIKGLYLSHSHPDHLLGAAQFSDVAFLTSDSIRKSADSNVGMYTSRKEAFGDKTDLVLPVGELKLGEMSWDNVTISINQVDGCEADHALTFFIPEAGVLIAQDLIYNNAHAFPLGNHDNWIAALEGLRNLEGVKVIGAGHGLPTSAGTLDDAVKYLKFQQKVLISSKDVEAATAALTAEYPSYGATGLLNFASFLY